MRYQFLSRESNPARDYHVDKYALLDNLNRPITDEHGTPVQIDRSVPKRVGKTRRDKSK